MTDIFGAVVVFVYAQLCIGAAHGAYRHMMRFKYGNAASCTLGALFVGLTWPALITRDWMEFNRWD